MESKDVYNGYSRIESNSPVQITAIGGCVYTDCTAEVENMCD